MDSLPIKNTIALNRRAIRADPSDKISNKVTSKKTDLLDGQIKTSRSVRKKLKKTDKNMKNMNEKNNEVNSGGSCEENNEEFIKRNESYDKIRKLAISDESPRINSNRLGKAGSKGKNVPTKTFESKNNVGEDYTLEKMIGKGSFGFVYKGVNRKTGEDIACKAEQINKMNKERLRVEYNLYKTFRKRKIQCVPRVERYLSTKEWNLMMMQLLGKSLDKIFSENESKLDLGTVMKIGIMVLSGLEDIHNSGVIHRDIKPNNFMFGRRKEGEDKKLYVVDFGLSKYWRDNTSGLHISHKQGRSMIGTARYASTHIHDGIEPSRRDDLESLGYVLVYLAKGRLPWQGLAKKRKGSQADEIGNKKKTTTTDELCAGLPSCFKNLIDYAKSLSFQQKPDYDLMRTMIYDSARKDDIEIILVWEDDMDYYNDIDADEH